MKKAIKTLEKRIEALNKEIERCEKSMEEPEMLCDYEFAMADASNFQSEIIEHQKAISVLNSFLNNDIQSRKDKFMEKVAKFTNDYPKEMLREFYDYWTEHGENDRKFRMEKEKSFDISKRLARWAKNSKFSANEKPKTINRQTEETIRKNAELIPTDFIDKIRKQNG